jgi:type VI secretion system protein ImpL
VPWSHGFGLYQGIKLDSAARAAYERMLVDAVQPRLALRVEEQLRGNQQPETLYEALKAYIMMYEPARFEAASLKQHIEADWDARLGREITQEQRDALSRHLDTLLAQGATVSPLPRDLALIDGTRNTLAAVALPQRVYNRLRNARLGAQFPEVTVVSASNPNAQLVFVRSNNLPLTKGVSGLFTYDGYHKGFKAVVGDATRQLASEQTWVLGIAPAQAQGPNALVESERLTDDVRRLYLIEYRETWKAFIDSVRMLPIKSMSDAIERTRILGAADSPLLPMLRRFSKETTLLAAGPGVVGQATQRAGAVVEQARQQVLSTLGVRPATTGAPGDRIESIVDDEFRALRALVTAPEGGGKAPVEGMVERLKEVQLHLMAVKSAVDAKQAPPASALPNQMRAEAANSPEPVRGLLEALGSAAGKIALIQLRESLSREVRAQIGDFCQQAVGGRYPFDSSSVRDVTPADFAALFGPGGRFEQMMTRLAPYVDTSTRPWRFLPVDGTPLGTDSGTLPQFQRAQIIREAFFAAGPVPGIRMTMKPLEMDTQLREFLLDVDGQLVKYDHGPQIPVEVKWPGPRNTNVVRVTTQPVGPGLVNDGAWALFRLFERVSIVPGSAPEKFKAVFDVGGRKATFDVTTSSVRNALRLPELRSFQCPQGL